MAVETKLTGVLPDAPTPARRDMRHAELRLRPGGAEILIDGVDIANSVQSIVVRGSYNEVPQLQLNLPMPLIEVDGEVQVTIPDATRNALIELGWTPPGGDA